MNEIKQKNIEPKDKTRQPEDHIVDIAYTFGQAKKKYKLLRYIDDAYLNILKQDGHTRKFTYDPIEEPYHELRSALCNALFRNIILEIYSIFFDNYSNVLSSYIIKAIKDCQPESLIEEYYKTNLLLKTYRDKNLAHKTIITKRSDTTCNYNHTSLNKLMKFSQQLFDWFIDYSNKNQNITDNNRVKIKYLQKSILDDKKDGTIDFFMKQIVGLDRKEIVKEIMDRSRGTYLYNQYSNIEQTDIRY